MLNNKEKARDYMRERTFDSLTAKDYEYLSVQSDLFDYKIAEFYGVKKDTVRRRRTKLGVYRSMMSVSNEELSEIFLKILSKHINHSD